MHKALHGSEYMALDDFEELWFERPYDEKWELIAGRFVRGMVGARLGHHLIVQNVNFALRSHIRAKGLPCDTFTETFWLKQRFLQLAVFPDVMVRCGPREPEAASIDDPLILVEVVSPSSEVRDRSEKASVYMRLASVKHICFIDRDRIRIDVLDRNEDGWLPRAPIESLEEALDFDAIDFSMSVADVYRDALPGTDGGTSTAPAPSVPAG